jgi:hypothetical protein
MFRLSTRLQGDWEAMIPSKWARELIMGVGSTPEEAVANLWLTLYQKSSEN